MISDLQKSIEKHTANNPELAIKFELGYALFKKAFCEVMENEQYHRMTSNVLTGGDGLEFEHEELYVPLGLVERKKQTKRDRQDGQPEKGSELYQYEEAINPISHDTFFNDVLWEGNSKSQGKRIAIIGEPGTGKTTFLQKIAEWILEVTDDVPIWINLGVLGQKTIREYLLEDWLRDASQSLDHAPAVWKSVFEQYLQEGKVWLLLDGVDEMGAENPLHQLALQLGEGWAKNVRIVLTCRLNVWEANKNELYRYNFDIYRNLDFDRKQIAQFINNWFSAINPDRGHKLNAALDEAGKERILDMVKNPLRLSLLCRTWQLYEGELPDTKAELYRQFVEAHYDWNRQTISDEKRQILNQALGKLALKAIDNEDSRFRLRESFIRQEMEPNLFSLALELGWLNPVGVAIENPGERVYAFYHPTFEEYFATYSITNWDFFLPCDHVDQPVEGKVYRIFESQWKEVFLLWLGRADIDPLDKENFIQALVAFNHPSVDLCDRFYHCRAFYIAAAGIAEFKDCVLANMIIDVIIQWGFYPEFGETRFKNTPIAESAREILLETNTQKAITALIKLIQSSQNTSLIEHLVSSLEEISLKNKQVINALTELLQCCQNESVIYIIVESLGRIGKGNSLAITALIELLQFSKKFDFDTIEELVYELGQIGKGNDRAITALIEFLQCSQDEFVIYVIVDSLGEIAQDRSQAERVINSLRESLKDELILEKALNSFLEIYCKRIIKETLPIEKSVQSSYDDSTNSQIVRHSKEDNEKKIVSLIELIQFSQDKATINRAVSRLGEIEQGNEKVITALVSLIQSSQSGDALRLAERSLRKIIIKDQMPRVIIGLKNNLLEKTYINTNYGDYYRYESSYSVLWQCAQTLSYPEFYKAWHSQPEIIHPEILENSPLANTAIAQTLNQQILDLPSQLQPTEKNYPLIINAQSLEDETDNSSIAQELCNQIYAIAFPDETNIPEINNAPQLKRLIPTIKKQLETKNLALIFHNGEPNETLIKFCKKLSDSIHIKWITEQPIKNGIPPQENLVNILQNWINQLD